MVRAVSTPATPAIRAGAGCAGEGKSSSWPGQPGSPPSTRVREAPAARATPRVTCSTAPRSSSLGLRGGSPTNTEQARALRCPRSQAAGRIAGGEPREPVADRHRRARAAGRALAGKRPRRPRSSRPFPSSPRVSAGSPQRESAASRREESSGANRFGGGSIRPAAALDRSPRKCIGQTQHRGSHRPVART